MNEIELSDDLLEGANAIASFLGPNWTPRKVYYAADQKALPIFRWRARLTARKSTIRRHIEDLERAVVS